MCMATESLRATSRGICPLALSAYHAKDTRFSQTFFGMDDVSGIAADLVDEHAANFELSAGCGETANRLSVNHQADSDTVLHDHAGRFIDAG